MGQQVTLNGWVAKRRNLGGLYFIDLRDRYGLCQLLLDGDYERVGLGPEDNLSPEDVIAVSGSVRKREKPNSQMATGQIELVVTRLERLSEAKLPPFEIVEDLDTNVELRLRYRYLDLRRPDMQRNLMHRSKFIGAMRAAFLAQDFCEVETPILTKATPEGARDYLVPSRVQPGKWYALPQSPQIFKQILMVAGMDRYFQVARCFRDEDLRADRQPEFTQLDMEMSFVEEEDVYACWETVIVRTMKDAMDVDVQIPLPRMTWAESMNRFGSDKPDTRFEMELKDLAEWVPTCDFGVFKGALEAGGRVMALVVPGGGEAISRGAMKPLEKFAKELGARGLAWWKPGQSGGAAGPVARFCEGEVGEGLLACVGASKDDLLLFAAGDEAEVWRVLGGLRTRLAGTLNLIPERQFNFLWVTDFPMFEWDEESDRWTSAHHPFTAPEDWDMAGDPASMNSRSYDMVLNGWELGSGSVRIHRPDVQRKVFGLLGIGEEEQAQKFGFLLEALSHGAPPHAGFAMGIDRIVALTLGMDSIRDVVAFPKTATATDLMCDAPSLVDDQALEDVHVQPAAIPEGDADGNPGS
ncbi:MAG: aspartyl-tRNA synthetase [Planctomycetota bacterium]